MQITWHGLGCVRLQTKETTVLIDPPSPSDGLSTVRLTADLFLFTSEGNPNLSKLRTVEDSVISNAGEYEFRGIFITGVGLPVTAPAAAATLYAVEAEGMTLGFFGALERGVSDEQLNGLKDIDVLFIPVGGKPVLTPQQATEIISQIEPRVIIPTHYKIPGLKIPLETVEKFTKELGVKSIETTDKLRISKKDLPEGDMKVIIVKP